MIYLGFKASYIHSVLKRLTEDLQATMEIHDVIGRSLEIRQYSITAEYTGR